MPVKLEVEGLDSFGDGTATLEVSEFRHVEWGSFGTSMIGSHQGKTEISIDLVEWLSPSDLRDVLRKVNPFRVIPAAGDRLRSPGC